MDRVQNGASLRRTFQPQQGAPAPGGGSLIRATTEFANSSWISSLVAHAVVIEVEARQRHVHLQRLGERRGALGADAGVL